MTWLKEYMANNVGVNTTGLFEGSEPLPPDTVPQAPYANPIAIPGTLEAENYDVGGQTQSYYDMDVANQGEAYRDDRVDVVATDGGFAIGYTQEGEWLEYTVNVASDGVYTYEVLAASGADGSSLRLYIDETPITEEIPVANGGDWDTYSIVKGVTASLAAGTHVLRLQITGSYVNIDNIKFAEEVTTNVLGGTGNVMQTVQTFNVYSIQGAYVQTFNAHSMSDLQAQMQSSLANTGVYLVRDGAKNKSLQKVLVHTK